MEASMTPISVLVVDDSTELCQTIMQWLSQQPGFEAVGCVTDWHRAVETVRRLAPAIVLLDKNLPGVSGSDLIAPITQAHPGTKVVMFSGVVSHESVERALDNGAAGYIVKHQRAPVMAAVIRQVAAGDLGLCPIAIEALATPPAAG